ncbi:MAG: TetR/AcrR family transcriptional regulator [Ignavibacteriales bacterium]|nr:MAG: TetR/AcrR family transcriptional regulator [Ignavibacteriaceae bacterium]MBW7872896.1 TetR/AcrR family transcriptional regulator [Ignavibacteria bacterium]MCZ2142475.1 TetR/AcrR family transcriptional regulator [Ignavibacteriales bacterium]OQY76279.1 MAG: hypothetical protein B6D45_04045 [Ignavibacteriales bacterium UTCHB3]MBV6445357.1 hypothetical protein [Ignavibacteriaceae bacterium]
MPYIRKPEPPSEPTRERIIKTASAQILLKGIKNTSLAEIAKAIKISKGTLYYHFRSKENLIEEIARANFEQISARIKEELSKHTVKKGRDAVSIVLEALTVERKNAKIVHLIFLEILHGNRKLGMKVLKIYQEMKKNIYEALLPFCKEPIDAARLTAIIVALAEGANLGNMLGMNEVNTSDAVKYLKV